ncbi:MAG TPA: VWA domain-containing protein [Bryobacteraceae bacterium]|nr:VWA domain-containing protein [Bryobacteraceae bacterium]
MRTFPDVRSAIGVVLSALLVSAQQPPAPTPSSPPDVVFSVTTSLVQLDAVVTDSKGNHVTDLTRDDFSVFEDGKPQQITHFSYVQVGQKTPAERKAEPKPASKSPAASAPMPSTPLRREEVRRTIVLMVDDLGISFETMAFVRSSLKKFVERQMQPGDLVAVCRTGSGSSVQQQFTSDKRILLAAVDALRWNPNGRAGLTFFEPYGKYPGGLDIPNGSAESLQPSYDVGRNTIFTMGTLGAINYVIGALREMPGRKSIVLFSDGIQLFTAAQGPVTHTGPGSVQTLEDNAEITEALHKLMDHANRAGTVIYTIHTAGLQTLVPDAQDRVDMTGYSGQQAQATLNAITQVGQPGGRDEAFHIGQQRLSYLAAETGGFPYENGNDLNFGLDRVLEDQQGYYLIGFSPPSSIFEEKRRSLNYHHITVKLNRPGYRVRSRSGFFGETDDEMQPKYASPLDQMRAAMLSPFQSSGVRLRLTSLYAEVPGRGPVVRNLLHIDTQDLTFSPPHELSLSTGEAAGSSAEIEIVAMATSLGDLPVASEARLHKVQAPAYGFQDALKEGVLYTLDVPVKKRGAYQIHVAVRDTATGKMGSASQFLEIPDLKKSHVALTSIVLQNGDRAAVLPATDAMSPATRQFRPGGQVEYFCLIEQAGKKSPAADLDSQIRIVRDGKDVYTGPAKLVPIDGGGLAVTGKLRLAASMTPGDYYLEVVAADRTVHKNSMAVQWTDFEIMP